MRVERFTQFPNPRNGEAPVDLWKQMYPTVPIPRSETYISTPYTSGPAKQFLLITEPHLNHEQVTERARQANSDFLDSLMDHFSDANTLTVPYHIGKREGWGELGYNTFWMHYISGASPDNAEQFEQYAGGQKIIDTHVFNDYAAPKHERLHQYKRLVNEYVDFVGDAINPLSKIIFMPGYESSFGCAAEKILAEKLQISREFVIFDQNHHAYAEKIGEKAPWLENHPHIKQNGGGTFLSFASSV